MKKLISALLCLLLIFSLTACGSAEGNSKDAYIVGICQLVQHQALDAATQGFKDALVEELGADKVKFLEENAAGDSATCSTICNSFVSEKVDLIMANATPALTAAASATDKIPILGTSVTDYASALDISDWNGTTGRNISGTCDLASLPGQADMIAELFPEAATVGILYCSAEVNSVYQKNVMEGLLKDKGFAVECFTFSDSNDVASVTANACAACDVLYLPTDNIAASCAETINNVALPAQRPIVCGEENLCAGCGLATLSISYYDLGVATGKMAAKILRDGADISAMTVESAPNSEKKFNADICSALGITPPEGYTAIG